MRMPIPAFALALVLIVFSGVAQAASPNPYRHDLRRVGAKLELAIEVKPGELGESLLASEAVCELAQGAEARGDAAAASADWSTLAQLVGERDLPGASAVGRAFANADSMLGSLRDHFSAGWRDQPEKVRALIAAVRQARHGIADLGHAMARIEGAFGAWSGHDCAAALVAIESDAGTLPHGIGEINVGMGRLWSLAYERGAAPTQ